MAIDPINIQSALRSISGEGGLGSPMLNPAAGPFEGPALIPSARPREISESAPAAAPRMVSGPSFQETLSEYIDEVNHTVLDADKKLADLAVGKSGDIHNALISMQKADLQVRLLVETRNKVISAYQEIMRMQA